MADDSIEIIEPPDRHQCDDPLGCVGYKLDLLTPHQKRELNQRKIDVVREDNKYLAAHPEIRAITSMIMRHVMRLRPRENLHEHVAELFLRPKVELQKMIDEYIEAREPHVYEGDSAVGLFPPLLEEEVSEEEVEEVSATSGTSTTAVKDNSREVARRILFTVLKNVYLEVGLDELSPTESQLLYETTQKVLDEAFWKKHRSREDFDMEKFVDEEILGKIPQLTGKILNEVYKVVGEASSFAGSQVSQVRFEEKAGKEEETSREDLA